MELRNSERERLGWIDDSMVQSAIQKSDKIYIN